jgi:hypothetical protein
MKAKLLSLFVVACLLPTLTLAGQRSEPRSLYQRPDGEWFLRCAISRAATGLGAVTGAANANPRYAAAWARVAH